MKVRFEAVGHAWESDLSAPSSIAIGQTFTPAQPNHFGVPLANRTPLRMGSFVGLVQDGRGCNVDLVQLIPHCNGTHTETVFHILKRPERIPPASPSILMEAMLLSVAAESADGCRERYRPPLEKSDWLITRAALEFARQHVVSEWGEWATPAVIVRTRPNPAAKCTMHYAAPNLPAFFSNEATEWLAARCDHLLVDLPSLDRTQDEGQLSNHHLFWNVPVGASEPDSAAGNDKTITELIYVDDTILDGMYLLNLQVPAWETDAAPSRPLLFAIQRVAKN